MLGFVSVTFLFWFGKKVFLLLLSVLNPEKGIKPHSNYVLINTLLQRLVFTNIPVFTLWFVLLWHDPKIGFSKLTVHKHGNSKWMSSNPLFPVHGKVDFFQTSFFLLNSSDKIKQSNPTKIQFRLLSYNHSQRNFHIRGYCIRNSYIIFCGWNGR